MAGMSSDSSSPLETVARPIADDRPVLVTGATGFVGAAVARALVRHGFRLRLMHRASSDMRNLAQLPGERVVGDLTDPNSLAQAVEGCSHIFHVAADYRLYVPDPAAMRAVNIDGTIALFRAAQADGACRMVYTSSVAALGLTHDGSPADEATPHAAEDHVGPYKRSKYEAELAVKKLVAEGLDIVIVNPAAPVGPGDIKPTPTGRMVLDAARGHMPAYVETGMNIVHVDDVAEGHVLALTRGRRGESYILGGENLMLSEIGRMITRLAGKPPPRVKLPIGPLMPVAALMEAWARISGHEPLMTRDMLTMARKRMFYSSEKAVRELGYHARPAEEAMRDALADFCRRGLLPSLAFEPDGATA
ncbi:NAD-dependent epimerase/dehydratase family protein [Acidiphilium multivorum]|jgi:dihydroflavonol-4-reductase|uniref:NAD-dependent epimerase/dehydratase family protein n=2 Tax=Acidocellaceae TaxID=3385905 RepID=F0J1B1_ACIMA|nr:MULTISPECIES: hopanoid-associated sugar epimerase [Acidiphilium]MBS3023685.1 NAD-dependent epimerase/dehydratase family protein [Acidiphilium multivorum]MBU6356294.1 NAD-dependent epimerase/dehydratase family protein [Rhodospirillales bacterium]BAJ79493.1 NAD-dependent epimerase/dehydratase family protein [Acidiphilium multivorum AIU301]GAN72463.1 epimerase/dehydratase [Acidiphilium multivorum AIU301]